MRDIVLIIDNVRSVFNTASMFRTADGVGSTSIALCGVTPLPLDRFGRMRPDFAKVALGAQETVQWKQYATTIRCISKLKKEGWHIIALEQAPGSISYEAIGKYVRGKKKIALVVGNEVEGVSKKILKKCDACVELPMSGAKESLNVAVAAGIALYALRYVH